MQVSWKKGDIPWYHGRIQHCMISWNRGICMSNYSMISLNVGLFRNHGMEPLCCCYGVLGPPSIFSKWAFFFFSKNPFFLLGRESGGFRKNQQPVFSLYIFREKIRRSWIGRGWPTIQICKFITDIKWPLSKDSTPQIPPQKDTTLSTNWFIKKRHQTHETKACED